MDREIDPGVRRRRTARRLGAGGAVLGLVLLAGFTLPGLLRPSVRRDQLRIAEVTRGTVEETLEATGLVVPASEKVLSSPIEARVLRVLRRPGALVTVGDAILELDTSASRLELERLDDRMAQKRNERKQAELTLAKTLGDVGARAERGKLDAEILEHRVRQQRRLRDEGLIAEDTFKETEVAAEKARIEQRQLAAEAEIARRANASALDGLALDLGILAKERADAAHRLELATTRADRAGVLTWVVADEGTTVRAGDVVARIADPTTFRVDASLSDVHAARLTPGQPVRVVAEGTALPARIAAVLPKIENGAVRFTVEFEGEALRDAGARLHDSQRVDVLVVTGARQGVLRVARGGATVAGASAALFKVQGDALVRTRVRFGVAGHETIEVLEGLAPGDAVVVSDMQDYVHREEVRIR